MARNLTMPDQLPALPHIPDTATREERIAAGVGLIASGCSVRDAAAATRLSRQTVYDHWRRYIGQPGRAEEIAAIRHGLVERWAHAALKAAEDVASALEERRHDLNAVQLATVGGIATDKLDRLLGWSKSDAAASVGSALGAALDRLAAGQLRATLTVAPAAVADPAADLEAEIDPDNPHR
jgi:hypothetical protein